MPIKDISKEEQSFLFLPGKSKRDPIRLKESDIGNQIIQNQQVQSWARLCQAV
jgi:hypothetical protein